MWGFRETRSLDFMIVVEEVLQSQTRKGSSVGQLLWLVDCGGWCGRAGTLCTWLLSANANGLVGLERQYCGCGSFG